MLSENVTKALQNYAKGFSPRNELRKCSYFIQQKTTRTRNWDYFTSQKILSKKKQKSA
jgi:hypothetical protein